MSSRVTRSSARLAAGSSAALSAASDPASVPNALPPPPLPPPPTKSRKRKAPLHSDPNPEEPPAPAQTSPARRTKKQKLITKEQSPPAAPPPPRRTARKLATMSHAGPSSGPAPHDENTSVPATGSSRRKSSRNKKATQDLAPSSLAPVPTSTKRSKKASTKKSEDVKMKDVDHTPKNVSRRHWEGTTDDDTDNNDGEGRKGYGEEDDEELGDPFNGGFLGRTGGPSGGISSTLRALSGIVSGVSSRLRDILQSLRQKEDASVQLIALGELSEILLVSNEDNLSGHFSPDQFIKELVTLMQPSEFGEENSEMMLLACRCIANLMEALPPSTANVVYGGAVPILCQKLLEIHFIDLAEQALSTLEKISVEFPASIVREGGLTACLTYLDFFQSSTQRTAVTTAANCCRNIPEDSFPVIRDVMPILLNVLNSNDQKVVEQGSLCVSRVVESFKYQQNKLEELISTDLLKAILRLLLPGTTNLIGPNIHTQFLRVLAITARASPSLSAELFKMAVVDTLYQILTGVSPPNGVEDIASKIDSVVVMQALIHRPREQVYETLNVICELLPGVQSDDISFRDDLLDAGLADELISIGGSKSKTSPNAKRIELLKGCKEELKRFAIILLPTLTDAYSSTVNLGVRQKVLTAQLKMLSNLDRSILENALRIVPYASYLASILSQQDHPTLVILALQAAELLLVRLESIYRYQFYREGVIAEISKLASKTSKDFEDEPKVIKVDPDTEVESTTTTFKTGVQDESNEKAAEDSASDEDNGQDDEDDDEDDAREDLSPSPTDSSSSDRNYPVPPVPSNLQDHITLRAQKFLDIHESAKGKEMRDKAAVILIELKTLARDIESCYTGHGQGHGISLFTRLSKYFGGDALESITSSELLNSDVVQVLLDVFSRSNVILTTQARMEFLEVFMDTTTRSTSKKLGATVPTTPFSILVRKLQDLLSRAEHFEVVTVHHNALDSNRSSAASMLAKQLRLKLIADDDSEIPRSYRNIMVSIHAIATFKALDDYLRPRISLSERPKGARHREGVSNALAAFAAAAGLPNPHQRLAERGLPGTIAAPSIPTPASTATTSRGSRKTSKTKGPPASMAPPAEPVPASAKEKVTRRSSRRQQNASGTPVRATEQAQQQLECADEKQLTDEDDLDETAALDAIVDDLEDEMEVGQLSDPTAVNMEVASTGKVTARKDDGTRVATPSQVSSNGGPPSSRAREPLATTATPSMAGRHMSYAAAIQAVPQDWHIEFSIDDKPLASETTVYRAVHYTRSNPTEPSIRNVWSAVHPVKFKRVAGPPPAETSLVGSSTDATSETSTSGMPVSLHQHPATSTILRLLNILHELNANLDDVLDEGMEMVKLNAEPLAHFVNTKLTAKLNRQLEEPLIVASNCIPSWSEDLARLYPFLFPFETRYLFLQSTSFGYSRSMTRWQNAQSADISRRDRHRDDRPFLGRLQRQKVRISRNRILESAIKVMELYGASPSVLEVEYFEEVGTGLGPTLEFYSTVSKEFSKKKGKLWRENESNEDDEYAFGKFGLFPAPMSAEQAHSELGIKTLHMFKMLGKFVARSMLDSRIIDVSFNPTFFRIGDQPSAAPLSLGAVKIVDETLATSLSVVKEFDIARQNLYANSKLSATQKAEMAPNIEIRGVRIDQFALDFTLPGYPAIELRDDGANVSVDIFNVGEYVEKVIDMTLGSGVQRQVDAFRTGFSQVFPYSALKAFTPSELVMLFGRVEEDWTLETLMDSIKADHGFNMDSNSVRNLLHTMSGLSAPQRRDFLQFVTGSPKLPIGGFKSLTPMFTVVCKPSEPPYTSDDLLPSVMTCQNFFKLPDYSSAEILCKRLITAIEEGQGAFHLS